MGNNSKVRGRGHRGELRIVRRGQANSQWKGRGQDGSPQEESAHERSREIGMPPESELVATVLVQMRNLRCKEREYKCILKQGSYNCTGL